MSAVHPSAWMTVKEVLASTAVHSDAVDEALEVFRLAGFADATPSELTQGQRKLVAVARALARAPQVAVPRRAGRRARRPRVGGVRAPAAPDRRPRHAGPAGRPRHGLVLGICDRIVVIEFGKVIATGTPAEVRADPNVIAAYLGSAAGELDEAG